MKLIAIYYTDHYFQYRETLFKDKLFELGFDDVHSYTGNWLRTTSFYEENKMILDSRPAAGYCLWKPYIILDAFNKIEDGDVLCYFDAGDDIKNGIVEGVRNYMSSNDYSFSTWKGRKTNGVFTKRDCFILMDCDNDKYYNATHIEAGTIALKKTVFNIDLVNDWLFYCKNPKIITKEPSVLGDELDEFKIHYYDQSILSNIIKMNELTPTNFLPQYIRYNYHGPK